jgi:hypothetical protein
MPRLNIRDFSRGLNTSQNPSQLEVGEARISQNLIHDYPKRARLRLGIKRTLHTRMASSNIVGLFQYLTTSDATHHLAETNQNIYSFNTNDSTGTSLDSGHGASTDPTINGYARFMQAYNMWLEADRRNNNYIGNGSNGYPFQIAAPTTAPTAPLSGSGITGTYIYTYARYSSTTTELSPASTQSVTATPANQTVTFTLNLAASEQFDQIRIYRTKNGGTQYYELTTQNAGSPMTYADTTADGSLTTISTLHTSAGASKTDRPAAATDLCFHRGRIHLVGLSGNRSRQRWSQIGNFSFDSTTDARHDVEPDDGDYLWRCFSYAGSLVLMKDHSIHLMNGDINELNFTWQVASDKNAAIGAYCPFTATPTPVGIIFLSQCGVFSYRPGGRPIYISGAIQEDLDDLDYSKRMQFSGEYEPCLNAYFLSVTPTGQTTNTITYVYFIDTGAWGSFVYGMGKIKPTCWAKFLISGKQKLFFGSSNGYIYETEINQNDGVISGTKTGTTTGGSDTTVVDSGAAFYSTGDDLVGIPVTVESSPGTYETQEVSSNTGTTLTTGSWTTDPTSGKTYYVGAIEGILSLGRITMGEVGLKHVSRLTFEFQKQTHSVNLLVGYTIDGDSEPTSVTATVQSGGFLVTIPVERRCVGISPYIKTMGNDHPFELLGVSIDYTLLESIQ